MSRADRIGILGGGRWGQALARLVLAAGGEPLIAYRDVKPPHVLPSTDDPPSVAEACELLLVATSAAEVRQAIQLARPSPHNRVVVAGRGLDPVTGRWLVDTVRDHSDVVRVGALVGPAPVDEILNGGLGAGVIATPFDEVGARVIEALHSRRYRVYRSDDLVGVQLAGAAMPVLAMLLGLGEHLGGAGVGVRAMVLGRGLAEVIRLGEALGARPHTFAGMAGVADLVAAQARPGHPHHDAGRALATGGRPTTDAPGQLARAVHRLAVAAGVETPLLSALVAILDGEPALMALGRLMERRARDEFPA